VDSTSRIEDIDIRVYAALKIVNIADGGSGVMRMGKRAE